MIAIKLKLSDFHCSLPMDGLDGYIHGIWTQTGSGWSDEVLSLEDVVEVDVVPLMQ